jgi:hypothetical protein
MDGNWRNFMGNENANLSPPHASSLFSTFEFVNKFFILIFIYMFFL